MNTNEEKVDLFIEKIREYLGTPFKHQGRTKNGIDCIGLIVQPLKELNYINIDYTNYKRHGFGGELIEYITKYCYEVRPPFKLKKGDILLYTNGNSQHLAIFTGNSIIHANNKIGKVVEHDIDDYWFNSISKVFRYKGD